MAFYLRTFSSKVIKYILLLNVFILVFIQSNCTMKPNRNNKGSNATTTNINYQLIHPRKKDMFLMKMFNDSKCPERSSLLIVIVLEFVFKPITINHHCLFWSTNFNESLNFHQFLKGFLCRFVCCMQG